VNNLDRVLFKIRKLSKALKGWGFNLAGSRKQKKGNYGRVGWLGNVGRARFPGFSAKFEKNGNKC
jgi:hypothetical protein